MKNKLFDAGDLVLGTWRFLDGDTPLTSAGIAEFFHHGLELGISTIDTAEIYGDYQIEAAIGNVFRENAGLREKLQIVTKAGIDVPSKEKAHAQLPHYNASAENLISCAKKSLRLLHTEQIDLFLVHRPDWLTHPEDTAAGLSKLLETGLVKQVGVSNYTVPQFETLDRLLDGKLATNQIEFSPFHMDPIYDGIFDQCVQRGIRPMSWSPLAQGRVFDANDQTGQRIRKCVQSLSEKYDGAGIDALVYAWILSVPSSPSVILGTSRKERLADAAKAKGITLERQDWYAIWEAAKGNSVP